jgi:non-ribosomal peptide synthase protein (TIGR01720 family)
VEAAIAAHEGVREVVVVAREDAPGDKRLVAYVVAGSTPPGVSELRAHLREKLPEYMMPAHFMLLDELPLSPNGKIDRKALPAPEATRPELTQSYVAPRNAVEETLAGIWSAVLGITDVGIHDNFFELGGDSILSLQITARSNQAGVRITLKQLFDNPTIARLATVIGTASVVEVEQGAVTGDVPLTPIQRLFFELNLPDPAHYNQATLLEVRKEVDAVAIAGAVKHLLAHHDALRLRFVREDGGVRQFNAAAEEHEVFAVIDLSGIEGDEQGRAVEAAAEELQRSLDPAAGPLIRVGLFDLGAGRPKRLLIVIHHLAVDGVSWRILMDDLHAAYEQLSNGQAVQLAPKTTSFKHWAERLKEYAQSDALLEEKDYWLADSRRDVRRLPVDYDDGVNTEASARTISLSLGEEETRALLQEVPAAYHTQINDVLMAGLAQTLLEWTGTSRVLVEMEGHGREELMENIDLSRTVGWFTSVFPMVLELEHRGDAGHALKSIKEQLRQVPHRGIGYGLLRHLRGDAALEATLNAFPTPEVCFNYLGQWDQTLAGDSPFTTARESGGATRNERGLRSYLLDISGGVGGGRLHMNCTYSENIHRRPTVEALMQNFMAALRAMIDHCRSPEAGGFTPSDFPAANLSQTELDNFISSLG